MSKSDYGPKGCCGPAALATLTAGTAALVTVLVAVSMALVGWQS